jgi:hypothetical protein
MEKRPSKGKTSKISKHGGIKPMYIEKNRRIIVLSVHPQNISFIILFHDKKGTEFALGLHCSSIVIANPDFVYLNSDATINECGINDLFLGQEINLENIFDLINF